MLINILQCQVDHDLAWDCKLKDVPKGEVVQTPTRGTKKKHGEGGGERM
jgi:hypothetical protein